MVIEEQSLFVEKTLFIALLVGLAHLVSGICVFVTPHALTATPLAGLYQIVLYFGYGNGALSAPLLIAAGLMAIVGSKLTALPRILHATLFLPQQVLLLLQMWTITYALIEGRYPDGYSPDGGAFFILSDQIWAWILAACHSVFLAVYLYGSREGGTAGTTEIIIR